MRAEKEFLLAEVNTQLDKSDYVFLTNYSRITVEETEELRASLSEFDAEFHVVKNSILNVAAKTRDLPEMGDWLTGPTAIIVGGNNPSGVAKVLGKFFKDKEKVELKGGALNERLLNAEEIEALSKLPSLDVLRAQLMGLLNTPAQSFVSVLNAVPVSVLNLLKAKEEQGDS
ncbi:MAG: 50S ribosomal protein L10 [Opitutales bacterium]|nr:50S ribosomal protein L10 [Opitutales bacterium]NRA28104.1 50S ribosomal protein L10 [Opitutales bacterium]